MSLNEIMDGLRNSGSNKIEYYQDGKKMSVPFRSVYNDVLRAANYLREMGIAENSKVGIYGKNSYDWLIIDLACLVSKIISIPLDINQQHDFEMLFEKYELSLIATNIPECNNPHLHIVQFSEITSKSKSGQSTSFEMFYEDNDIFTVIISSGTTGISKSIEIKKKSFDHLVNVSQDLFQFNSNDKFLVFLPLHIYLERVYIYSAILLGFNIILTPLEYVFKTIKTDKPTVLIGVPYFFENVEKIFMINIRSKLINRIVFNSYVNLTNIGLGFIFKRAFTPFKNLWGGKMRYLMTGSAPIKRSTLDFYKLMGVIIYEGYGMSEIGGMISLNSPKDVKLGSVGKPFPGKEVRFDESGQILVKSLFNASSQYFKSTEAENKTTFLSNDTVATGDIGYMDKEGFLFISGRIKEVIILGSGIKIFPFRIEEEIYNSGYFDSCLVSGNDRPYLIALLVPKLEHRNRLDFDIILGQINKHLTKNEKVMRYFLFDEPFTIKNGMLNSSLKVNRTKITDQFSSKINDLYKN